MLALENVTLAYDGMPVVVDATFTLNPGEIGCILGPSGCGKSTLLRGIAGFETLFSGTIHWEGEPLSTPQVSVAPENRRIGMVFQNFALFPHLDVKSNIAFGLRGQSKQQQMRRVNELLDLFGITGKGNRAPHSLSGGEQQRVALARALAPKPRLLLMDEPFSSLDVELRQALVPEVRRILQHESMSAILVTHDQREAFALADRVCVINAGRVHQWDEPYALYHRPATRFVAEFVGEGIMLEATAKGNGCLSTPLGEFDLPEHQRLEPGSKADILVRPDDILHDDASEFKAEITHISFRGSHYQYRIKLENGSQLLCFTDSHHKHQLGEKIGLLPMLEHLVIFEQDKSSIVEQHLTHPPTIASRPGGGSFGGKGGRWNGR